MHAFATRGQSCLSVATRLKTVSAHPNPHLLVLIFRSETSRALSATPCVASSVPVGGHHDQQGIDYRNSNGGSILVRCLDGVYAIMSKPKAEKTKRAHVEVKKVEPTRIRVKVVPAKGHTHFEWRPVK